MFCIILFQFVKSLQEKDNLMRCQDFEKKMLLSMCYNTVTNISDLFKREESCTESQSNFSILHIDSFALNTNSNKKKICFDVFNMFL